MRFTKGALGYDILQNMPYNEIFKLNETASKISNREKREAEKK